ncbi:hypothetical protein [Streptomyces xanthochromogenes]|uniref:hypothetical protein n=1 Tax=Streptomyces xanthochromogenes TaxID=67384 RepID=UPI00341B24D2
MPSEELRQKILLNKEKKEMALLPGRLGGLEVMGYVSDDDVPSWVSDSLREFRSVVVEPHVRIDGDSGGPRLDEWHLGLLRSAQITERFFCSTGMRNFPWVDCRVSGENWIRSIREGLGGDLYFLSHEKNSLVVIFEEEYEYIGFSRHAPASGGAQVVGPGPGSR